MLDGKLDPTEPTPLYLQAAAEIRRAIAEGEAGPGDRLPLAKDLAKVLGVNTNTILRALRTLRDEGLLEFRRGRGITVASTPQRGAVVRQVNELVEFARAHGYRRDELIGMIKHAPWPRAGNSPAATAARRG
jgi:GntR family transcriptional regulator